MWTTPRVFKFAELLTDTFYLLLVFCCAIFIEIIYLQVSPLWNFSAVLSEASLSEEVKETLLSVSADPCSASVCLGSALLWLQAACRSVRWDSWVWSDGWCCLCTGDSRDSARDKQHWDADTWCFCRNESKKCPHNSWHLDLIVPV